MTSQQQIELAKLPCPRSGKAAKPHNYRAVGVLLSPPNSVYTGSFSIQWITTCTRCGFQWTS